MDKQQAIDVIHAHGLSRRADLIVEHLLPSVRLSLRDDAAHRVDQTVSHFGGLPSLPRGTTWPVWDKHDFVSGQIARLENKFKASPRATGLRDIAARMRDELSLGPRSLPFLAQLSLPELHSVTPLPGWPREGTLAFFCETSAWGFDPLARGHCRVLFSAASQELTPARAPKDLPDDASFPHRRLQPKCEWTLPTRITIDGNDMSIWGDRDYRDVCQQLMPGEDGPVHRCGGHPQEIQGDMRLECQLVTNGLYCGDSSGYEDPRRATLERGAADWQLLLQIDSDEKRLGWMWGDSGRVYFWARQQDIEAGDFDSSWAVLQCH